jgi:hypothetical protein
MRSGWTAADQLVLIFLLVAAFATNIVASCFYTLPHSVVPLSFPGDIGDVEEAGLWTERIEGPVIPFDKQHFSTDSFFTTNGMTPSLTFERKLVQRSPRVLDIYVRLPPFYWALPLGFDEAAAKLFWLQPENHRHFKDSTGHVMGKVQVFYNATLVRGYSPWNNQSHYFNYDTGMVVPCANPKYDVVMFLSGHDTHYFQHFLDNGIPHISLMEMATGIDPSEITFVINTNTRIRKIIMKLK